MAEAIDLLQLDREIRVAWTKVEERRAALTAAPNRDLIDPFAELRHTAGQATYRALAEAKPGVYDVAHRDALLRWVHELLQARIGHDLVLDEADAAHAVDPQLARPAKGTPDTPSSSMETIPRTYAEAWRALLLAPDVVRAASALERVADLALPIGAVRKEQRARRFEASRRLGLAHPWSLASGPGAGTDFHALSRAFLDATEPLAAELRKDAQRKADAPWRASSMMQLALAKDAREGWPGRPLARWLDDVFKPLVPRGLRVKGLPSALGGATFLRAGSTWGFTWKVAATPKSMPFALARDPYPAPAHRFGNAVALAVAEPSFQRRALELPSRLAITQARWLRVTAFLHARTHAARVVLGTSEHVDESLFEEMTMRAFGTPLPMTMRDAWPAPRIDDPARLLALVGTRAFVKNLVDRYDEDWFRNPKAGTHLTSLACGPAFDPDPPPATSQEGDVKAIAKWFEEVLG